MNNNPKTMEEKFDDRTGSQIMKTLNGDKFEVHCDICKENIIKFINSELSSFINEIVEKKKLGMDIDEEYYKGMVSVEDILSIARERGIIR